MVKSFFSKVSGPPDNDPGVVIKKPIHRQRSDSDFGTTLKLSDLARTDRVPAYVSSTIRNKNDFATPLVEDRHTPFFWYGCVMTCETDIILPTAVAERLAPTIEDCLNHHIAQGHPTENTSMWVTYVQGPQGRNKAMDKPFAGRPHFDGSITNLMNGAVPKESVFTFSTLQKTAFYNQAFKLDPDAIELYHSGPFDGVTHAIQMQITEDALLDHQAFDVVYHDHLHIHKQDIGPVEEFRVFGQITILQDTITEYQSQPGTVNNPPLLRKLLALHPE